MSVCHIIKTRNPYEPASPSDCGTYYLCAQSCLKRTSEDLAWTFNFLSSRMRDSIERLLIAYVAGTEIPLVAFQFLHEGLFSVIQAKVCARITG